MMPTATSPRLKALAASLLLACGAAACASPTSLRESIVRPCATAQLQVMDRSSGATLPVYDHVGERWIAGAPGHRYAVRIRNCTADRLLAVLSVDGVNAVTGQTAAWGQAGYVLAGRSQAQIDGWRKDTAQVADFEFSAPSDSYAARTGRPGQVGVIGVALFREQQAAPAALALPPAARGTARESAPAADAAGPATPADAARADAARSEAQASNAVPALRLQRLGTAHGAVEDAPVTLVDFTRASASPDELLTVRYESMEMLVALGVVAPTPPPVAHPQAFPGSVVGFVPDPPAR